MKFALVVLALFVASALGRQPIQHKAIRFHDSFVYKYRYSGQVLTGIPSVSDRYSGYHLTTDILFQSHADDVISMRLTNVTLGQAEAEVFNVEDVQFETKRTESKALEAELSKPVTFQMKDGLFVWLEADSNEAAWSLNIKKSIIDLFQVDIEAKKPIHGEHWGNNEAAEAHPKDLVYYGVYEKGIKGICETTYERSSALDVSRVNYMQGQENFVLNVTKTRNYENCMIESNMVRDNFDKKGCAVYCQHLKQQEKLSQHQQQKQGLNKYLPLPDEVHTASKCPCDDTPVDQYSTVKYNITYDAATPTIEGIWSEGKVIVDNHGTQFAVLTHQRVHLIGQSVRQSHELYTLRNPIKYDSLVFTTYNQTSQGMAVGHEIPFYNLFVPPTEQELIVNSVEMMKEVARLIIAGELTKENERSPWYVTRFIQNMAYLDADKIEIIYEKLARLSGRSGAYTNTMISVQRQLFLDALPYVGTNEAAKWILQSIERGYFTQFEARQLIELLPRNYYYPAKSVLDLFARKIETLARSDKHQYLAAFTVTFSKLVAKSCQYEKNEWSPEYRDSSSEEWRSQWAGYEPVERSTLQHSAWDVKEICRKEDAEQYVNLLARLMDVSKTFHTKMIFAQGLVHTGQYSALQILEPFITGTLDHQRPCPGYVVMNKTKVHEECNFFRTAVIYALHNMIPYSPKLIRSMVLPVYRNTEEAYELRIAAFTVFLASGPVKHELESVASGLRHENNRQVIYMVKSILENAANLTSPCNQPLAEAVQQILPSLPKINLDGYYSQANWNEWYSDDKNTGFYTNAQFVANNVSAIPRAGYLSFGSQWGTFQNGWFTVAFQQKGFEKLFWNLLKPQGLLRELASLMVKDPSVEKFHEFQGKLPEAKQEEIMDRYFEKLGIVPRVDEDPKAKIFFKLYEQTTLMTLDQETLRELFEEFSQTFIQWSAKMMQGGDFHWVRFFMPASYQQVVPNDLGLPVFVQKKRPHIVSLKIENTKLDLLRAPQHRLPVGFNFSAIVTPQIHYASVMSVATMQQGIHQNIGVSTIKKTSGYLPIQMSFGYNMAKDLVTFSFVPKMGKTTVRQRTLSRSFLAFNQIGLPVRVSPFYSKQELTSLPAPFMYETTFGHPTIGMDLGVKVSTHRPWFFNPRIIVEEGLINACIEKYHELNQFNHKLELTLKPNEIVPVTGFQGTLKYKFVITKIGEKIRAPEGEFDLAQYERVNEIFGSEWTKKAVDINKKIAAYPQYYDDANIFEYDEILEKITRRPRQDVPLETKVTEMIEKSRNIWAWSYPAGQKMNEIVLTRNLIWTLWTISPEPTFAAGNLYYTRTINHQTHWIKAEALINGADRYWSAVPNVWSGELVFAHQPLPNELYWDPIEAHDHKAKFAVILGYGDQVPEEQVKILGTLERTPDRVLPAGSFAYQAGKPWFVQQCMNDKAQGKSLSYPCQLAAYHHAYFNHVDIDVDWKNLPEELINMTTTLNTLVKAWYFPWVSVNTVDVNNVEGHMDVTIDHSNRIDGHPMVNLEVRSPRETVFYKFAPALVSRLPDFFPPMYTKASIIKDQTCALMENHVRTFDNVTYGKPLLPCEYVLAMDCSEQKRFAVIVNEQSPVHKMVKMIVRGHEIQVAPPPRSGDKVDVMIDGQQYTVEVSKPIVLHRELELFSIKIFLQPVHKESMGHNIVIEMPLETLRVVTNGKLVKVTTGMVYSGKTCGLCGNSDHEAEEEFQAPIGSCVYEHPEDFLFSYTLGSQCRKPSQPLGPYKCAGKPTYWSYPSFGRRDSDEMTYPVEKRNMILVEGNKKCFSRFSLPACAEGEKVYESEQWPVDFVCLPAAGHPVYSQWFSEASSRLIHEISSLEKTMTKVVMVPKTCVRGL